MKKLNLAILTIGIGLAVGSFARAQTPADGAPPPHRHGHHNLTEMLDHTLH